MSRPLNPVEVLAAVLRKRAENDWRHLHHRDCIHNLPPGEQVTIRGRTVEWWTTMIGELPQQITPEQWETEPPNWDGEQP